MLPDPVFAEGIPLLPAPGEARDIAADYRSLGLTLRRHPLALLRDRLRQRGWLTAHEAGQAPAGAPFRAAGLVISRQRPGSAGGVVFITLEDETGHLNLIVWPALADRQRQVMTGSRLLGVLGRIQRQEGVLHLLAQRLCSLDGLLGGLDSRSRDFG